jgi:hypothetical protein
MSIGWVQSVPYEAEGVGGESGSSKSRGVLPVQYGAGGAKTSLFQVISQLTPPL